MNVIFYLIAKGLSFPLEFIYNLTGNYAVTIIILALIVKAALYPLYHTQMKQELIMRRIRPKIAAIQNKYIESADTESAKKEIVELYEEANVNPMFSFVILIVQTPFLFGLFTLLRHPEIMGKGAYSADAHQPFLWISDLTLTDKSMALPIIAALVTFVSLFMIYRRGTQHIRKRKNDKEPVPLKKMITPSLIMTFIFPLLMLWFGHGSPSGIVLYWIASCLFSAVQSKILFDISVKRTKLSLV